MISEPVIDFLKKIITDSSDKTAAAHKVIAELETLCEKEGYDQSQLLIIRAHAVEQGVDGRLFQPLLENTKMDNISFFTS